MLQDNWILEVEVIVFSQRTGAERGSYPFPAGASCNEQLIDDVKIHRKFSKTPKRWADIPTRKEGKSYKTAFETLMHTERSMHVPYVFRTGILSVLWNSQGFLV